MNIFAIFGVTVVIAQRAKLGPLMDIEKFFQALENEDPSFFDAVNEAYPDDYSYDYPYENDSEQSDPDFNKLFLQEY